MITNCRSCNGTVREFVDFGSIPLVNAFTNNEKISGRKFPLRLMICDKCKLCQIDEIPNPDLIYRDYKHISSGSVDNLNHIRDTALKLKNVIKLDNNAIVLEVGCNDGSLLQQLNGLGMRTIGIDPAKNLSHYHKEKKVEVISDHLDDASIKEVLRLYPEGVDAIVGLNVFAHFESVPSIFKKLNNVLKDNGSFYLEVAYALETIYSSNYDTVYHEHVFNWSAISIQKALNQAGFYVESMSQINTQGGSLSVLAKKGNSKIDDNKLISKEVSMGLTDNSYYENASKKIIEKIKAINESIHKFIEIDEPCLLLGAPARGVVTVNTSILNMYNNLNFIDDTPEKKDTYFPGTNHKVLNWDSIRNFSDIPKKAILLSWNYKDTIIEKAKQAGFQGEILQFSPEIQITTT